MSLFKRKPKAKQADLEILKAELLELRNELTKRTNALSLVTAATNGLDQKITIIDKRLATMTTELSHQLHDLGREIETISKTTQESASREDLEQLKVNQTPKAKDHERYEKAFRQHQAEIVVPLR
ncbi:MAG: hypothetical protein ACKOQX_05155, partial [Actinomycetota bacterium]